MGMVRKIETMLEEGISRSSNQSLLPRLAAQKKRFQQSDGEVQKGDREVKLMYEENMVQLALERKRMVMLKGSAGFDEEEAKRKFAERGIQLCEFNTRDKCNQSRGSIYVCTKTHFKKIIKSYTETKLGNCKNLDNCNN